MSARIPAVSAEVAALAAALSETDIIATTKTEAASRTSVTALAATPAPVAITDLIVCFSESVIESIEPEMTKETARVTPE